MNIYTLVCFSLITSYCLADNIIDLEKQAQINKKLKNVPLSELLSTKITNEREAVALKKQLLKDYEAYNNKIARRCFLGGGLTLATSFLYAYSMPQSILIQQALENPNENNRLIRAHAADIDYKDRVGFASFSGMIIGSATLISILLTHKPTQPLKESIKASEDIIQNAETALQAISQRDQKHKLHN